MSADAIILEADEHAELEAKIEAFIDYFNKTMAKPFKWTYQGRPLAA
jgi:hypothetical protein